MLAEIYLTVLISSSAPSVECLAAARRMSAFMLQEAKGTRHEQQILRSYEKAGGVDKAIAAMAAKMKPDACNFIMLAHDSTIRALAVGMLPERNGE